VHTHPLGQTLIVLSGVGLAQREGGAIEEIRPGDIVWFAPGEKHWHGASPTVAMTHIATQEELNGKMVDWMKKVNDEQYQMDKVNNVLSEYLPSFGIITKYDKSHYPHSSFTDIDPNIWVFSNKSRDRCISQGHYTAWKCGIQQGHINETLVGHLLSTKRGGQGAIDHLRSWRWLAGK
jgi:hypothetical protein